MAEEAQSLHTPTLPQRPDHHPQTTFFDAVLPPNLAIAIGTRVTFLQTTASPGHAPIGGSEIHASPVVFDGVVVEQRMTRGEITGYVAENFETQAHEARRAILRVRRPPGPHPHDVQVDSRFTQELSALLESMRVQQAAEDEHALTQWDMPGQTWTQTNNVNPERSPALPPQTHVHQPLTAASAMPRYETELTPTAYSGEEARIPPLAEWAQPLALHCLGLNAWLPVSGARMPLPAVGGSP